jgi:hypothetical protein
MREGGGRFYYTGAGHAVNNFKENYWLRRQLYNAVLWSSGWTPPSRIQLNGNNPGLNALGGQTRVSAASLSVTVDREGAHAVEICGLDGKRVALEKGVGKMPHTFANLKPHSVYAVLVSSPHEKTRQLI